MSGRKLDSLWIAIIAALALLNLYYLFPLFFGTPTPFLYIRSESMIPSIQPGDIVLLKGINDEQLEGEVIAYLNPANGKIIVHRIVREEDGLLVTKGDNNPYSDFFMPSRDSVLGRVILKI
jgi:signal peptidase I